MRPSFRRAISMGLSDESRLEPEDDRGDDDHRAIVGGALFVAGGQSAPLLEPIDTTLDHIPTGVDRLVEGERTARPSRPPGTLIPSLGDCVRDLALAQQATTTRVAVALVSDDALWTCPWSSTPSRPWDTNAGKHRL